MSLIEIIQSSIHVRRVDRKRNGLVMILWHTWEQRMMFELDDCPFLIQPFSDSRGIGILNLHS